MLDIPKLHALAALDKEAGTLRLLLGKYEDDSPGDTQVVLKNIGRLFSSQHSGTVHLCAEQIPDVGSGPLEAPVVTLDRALSVENEELSFTLPQFYHSDAYRVVLSLSEPCRASH